MLFQWTWWYAIKIVLVENEPFLLFTLNSTLIYSKVSNTENIFHKGSYLKKFKYTHNSCFIPIYKTTSFLLQIASSVNLGKKKK